MKSSILKIVVAWVVWLGMVESAPMVRASEPAGEARAGSNLFDAVKVIPITITIDPEAIVSLNTNASDYVSARVEAGGRVYPNVGLHLKGVSTFETLDKKPSLTLKFNEFEEGGSFRGLKKVLLNNAHGEDTYVQEFLARDLFRAAGVRTPRLNYARVKLNGRDRGLYLLIEGITGEFLKDTFGTKKGNLYEADENDVHEQMEQDFGKRSRRQVDLASLVMAVKERDLAKRFEKLEKALDLDEFISYVAIEALINVWDGYTMRINNYRVFCNHKTGKVTFLPHGLDNIFAEPTDPLIPETKGQVSKALLETSEGMRRYRRRFAELHAALLKQEVLYQKIDAWVGVIAPTLAELDQTRAHQNAIGVMKKRIKSRIDFINENLPAFLAGKDR